MARRKREQLLVACARGEYLQEEISLCLLVSKSQLLSVETYAYELVVLMLSLEQVCGIRVEVIY